MSDKPWLAVPKGWRQAEPLVIKYRSAGIMVERDCVALAFLGDEREAERRKAEVSHLMFKSKSQFHEFIEWWFGGFCWSED